MVVIAAGTMVLDGQVCRPGWLQTSGGRIAACSPGPPPRPADFDFPDCTVVPGFIDMHVHGGGGASYTDAGGIADAAAFHLRHGTTTTLASLVTASPVRTARRGARARRSDPAGHRRGHSPRRAVAEPGALRSPRPHPDA